ncbi:Hypothetical protein, putative [Bodo saltans]|uniref:Uncharacterized protein n=1 Tax=Bodo saltans TaxID=75058 RepID=A0A0S4JPH9_BODSA|nr:Hypothetical protein, putative [Bodo saltans]|eukprot:CUG90409.1 Hypothetical protein, putative [Bodo saltans]
MPSDADFPASHISPPLSGKNTSSSNTFRGLWSTDGTIRSALESLALPNEFARAADAAEVLARAQPPAPQLKIKKPPMPKTPKIHIIE